jgi:hypothetical protein
VANVPNSVPNGVSAGSRGHCQPDTGQEAFLHTRFARFECRTHTRYPQGSAARNSVCSFHEVSSVISWLTMTPIRTVSQRGQYQQSNSVRQRSGWLRVLQARQRGTVIASRVVAIVGQPWLWRDVNCAVEHVVE